MRASIFLNYKKHVNRFLNCEKSAEADFNADERSFADVASVILEALDAYVKDARARRR
jgi:hypothetical protein